MPFAIRLVLIPGLLLSGAGLATAQASPFEPQATEFRLGSKRIEQSVSGVPLTMDVATFLALRLVGPNLEMDVRVVADLSDLQSKIGVLIDTFPLPKDNCARFSADNLVVEIREKRIVVSGNVATLALKGEGEVWWCIENPFGSPAKGHFPRAQFTVSLPVRLNVVDDHTVALHLSDPAVDLKGDLGDVTEFFLRLVRVDLSRQLKSAFDRAINPAQLRASLPEELVQIGTLRSAELFSHFGSLAGSIELTASTDKIGELEKALRALGLLPELR